MLPELWSSYAQVTATAVKVVLLYAGAVAALRIAGRRTLAQMSAFDVVVTIAIGSILAAAVVPAAPAVSDGLTALLTLLFCQVVVGALRQRIPRLRTILDFTPLVVFRQGQLELRQSPTSAQLTEDELFSMLRQQEIFSLGEVRLIVLEPNGKISVARDDPPDGSDIIQGVQQPLSPSG